MASVVEVCDDEGRVTARDLGDEVRVTSALALRRPIYCVAPMVGQCDLPVPEEGVFYTQASAGYTHVALLRSDGRAWVSGEIENEVGGRFLPHTDITEVSAGGTSNPDDAYCLLLKRDGRAVACGRNRWGKRSLP